MLRDSHASFIHEAKALVRMNSDDPFEDLYADEEPYDKQRLADIVGKFIQVNKNSGEPVRQQAFQGTDPEGQIVAFLLYRRIAVELGELNEKEKAAIPERIADYVDANDMVVSSCASDLSFIQEFDPGVYYIPEHSVEAAVEELERYL